MSGPCVTDSPSIHLHLVGTPAALQADLIESAEYGNVVQVTDGGIFVPGIVDLGQLNFIDDLAIPVQVRVAPQANVSWLFRYNPLSTASHKWEFCGGADAYIDIETEGTINSNQPSGTYGNWVDLSGTTGGSGGSSTGDVVGPDFIPPYTGIYNISFGADINPINGEDAQCGLSLNGADPNGNDTATATGSLGNTGSTGWTAVTRRQQKTLTAGQRVRMLYRGSGGSGNAATHKFQRRWLSVTPVRCDGSRAAGTYPGT